MIVRRSVKILLKLICCEKMSKVLFRNLTCSRARVHALTHTHARARAQRKRERELELELENFIIVTRIVVLRFSQKPNS